MSFLGGGNVLGPHTVQADYEAGSLRCCLAAVALLEDSYCNKRVMLTVMAGTDRRLCRPTAVTRCCLNSGGLLEGTVPKSGKDWLPNPALSNSTKAYKVTRSL